MASEKQIAANRANAKKSTGPKTAAGKAKSSRNALRHGLSSPLPLDATALAKAHTFASAFAGEGAGAAALEVAHAQLELERIKATRDDLMAAFDPVNPEAEILRQILSLGRYERYAFTRRHKALRKL